MLRNIRVSIAGIGLDEGAIARLRAKCPVQVDKRVRLSNEYEMNFLTFIFIEF
jgi:hypothetical protein